MTEIANIINKSYIPLHTVPAIVESLNKDLNVINYSNLNLDKPGLKYVMDLAVEGGILKKAIDIESFASTDFATEITSTTK